MGHSELVSGLVQKGEKMNSNCKRQSAASDQQGFTLAELMVAMMVFTVILGSVVLLLTKSQKVFRTEQGVSEMDQNARLLIDFLTRDIQQSKENALGLGPKFRSIYSYDGTDGKTDEITIVSSDTDSKLPGAALPFTPWTTASFSSLDRQVQIVPNGAAGVDPYQVLGAITVNEDMIISGPRPDGSTQFDFIKVKSAKVTGDGTIAMTFEPVQPKGVQPEVPFGGTYEDGNYSIRPCAIKRYYIDRTDKEHPTFALSVNENPPMHIARNVVALQMRYLELKDGELDGAWVKQQNISRLYKTQAIEVTMTARTEIKGDPQAERLVTLASVIR